MHKLIGVFLLAFMFAGCQTQTVVQSGGVDCYNCHDAYVLTVSRSDESLGVKEWLQAGGQGLVMVPAYNPPPLFMYVLEWPSRGRHVFDLDTGDCAQCHPIYNNVENHSNSMYPPEVQRLLYLGGADCASNCHAWLDSRVGSKGFVSDTGTTPTYSGTLDPYTLLTDVKNAHSNIFLYGFRITQDDPDLDMRSLNAGCGGCHNWDGPRHGHIADCTDCHVFDPTLTSGVHQKHIDMINATRARIDPGDAGMPACAYCHGFSDTTANHVLSDAACYNCHLSGHQPMGADGMPQFWDLKQ